MERQRIITAAVGLPLLLFLLWLGGWWLIGALIILGLIGGAEYARLTESMWQPRRWLWLTLGFAYIALGFSSLYFAREMQGALWLLLIIWATDTAAYEFGRRIGRQPLAPRISPKKTLEGALAGILAALLVGGGYAALFLDINLIMAALISVLISALGQMGDLLESYVKRQAGVKDSGRLLPGHGGVLDRFDSILLAAPFMCLLLLLIA